MSFVPMYGVYSCLHPDPVWEEVLIRIEDSQDTIPIHGKGFPAGRISLWKNINGTMRKLRDGLYGGMTLCTALSMDSQILLVLYDPLNQCRACNLIQHKGEKVYAVHPFPEGAPTPPLEVYITAEPLEQIPQCRNVDPGSLPGVYEYQSRETGTLLVGIGPAVPDISTQGRNLYPVYRLKRLPGLGWGIIAPGLFGGSVTGDRCFHTAVEAGRDGAALLRWYPLENNRHTRTQRILTAYPDGSIGLGGTGPEDSFKEETVMVRIGNWSSSIQLPSRLLIPEGRYLVNLYEENTKVLLRIIPTEFRTGPMNEQRMVYRVVRETPAGFSGGILPADDFDLAFLADNAGGIDFVWYSRLLNLKEHQRMWDFSPDGGFSLGRFTLDGDFTAISTWRRLSEHRKADIP
ncbi:MAG: hypothetical protein JXB03_08450 [Spirochaetales bacterium]|nr:hypothetical protein [Spirochaetales bacterium]